MTLPSAASSPRSSSKTPNRAIDRPTRNQAHRLASLSTSESHQGLFVVGQVQILHAFGGVPSHCPSISTRSFRTLLNPAVSIFASLAIPSAGLIATAYDCAAMSDASSSRFASSARGSTFFLGSSVRRPAAPSLAERLFQLSIVILDLGMERKSLDHGVIAKSFAQAIDCLLGFGGPAIDKIGKVRAIRARQRGNSDSDQAEHGAVAFLDKQLAADAEDADGELGRVCK